MKKFFKTFGGVLMGIVVVFGILSVLCNTLLAGTPLASALQQLGGGAGATAANVALDASGIKGKIDGELRSHAGDIAAATGLSEGQVEDIINQIDISSWSVTTLPADATVAGSFQTSYQGTNVTVTTYTDPSYVSISPWGQTITLAGPRARKTTFPTSRIFRAATLKARYSSSLHPAVRALRRLWKVWPSARNRLLEQAQPARSRRLKQDLSRDNLHRLSIWHIPHPSTQ